MTLAASKRICLVTPGHLSTNPRLVKEADALHAAGYHVTVISCRFIAWADEADGEFAERPWISKKAAFGPLAGRRKYLLQKIRRQFGKFVYKSTGLMAEHAFHPAFTELTKLARATRADLYLAHNLAALPAAAKAAEDHEAILGFDAEDFHSGELPAGKDRDLQRALTENLEARYLPRCAHLTAASVGIADAYASKYRLKVPTVVHNVFPIDSRICPPTNHQANVPFRLYWFSQTIGPGRGLEEAIEAIALLRGTYHLEFHIRGNTTGNYVRSLCDLANRMEVSQALRIQPPALPRDMISLAAAYDIGLAGEIGETQNRDICVTNKLFTYLLAGLAVVASDTKGQLVFSRQHPDAIRSFRQGDARSLAEALAATIDGKPGLYMRRSAAWILGQRRYNWEVEKQVFLKAVASVLEKAPLLK